MSPLQTQYPLSPRKFWKKIIQKTFVWLVLLVALSFVSVFALIPVLLGRSLGTPGMQPDFGHLFILAALSAVLALILIMGLYAWYVQAYIRRYYYDASEQFVTIKKGVFAPAEIHVQYQKIQDVYVDQDILDRIMGLYDVHIASATITSGIEAHIDGVDAAGAEGLKNLLLSRLQSGGTPPAAMNGTPVQSAAPVGPVKLSEDISTRTYPLAGGWVAQQAVNSIFYSLFYTLLLAYFFFAPGRTSGVSITTAFSLNAGSILADVIISFIVIYILHLIYMVVWRSTFFFEFLPEYISRKQGIIARSEVHLPYRTVQDVVVSQSFVERMLGLATVKIQNAAQQMVVGRGRVVQNGILVPGQPIERANHLAELVRGITVGKNSSQTGL